MMSTAVPEQSDESYSQDREGNRALTRGRTFAWTTREFLFLATLCAVTIFAFFPTIRCGFNVVDDTVVAEQPHVNTGLTAANVRWAFTTTDVGYPIPVTLLSFMVDVQLFGVSPAAFHAENIAWHVVDVALLYLLLRRLTGCSWRSFVVSLLFAVHPLRVESVAWVTERKDVLAAFFGLLSLHAYVSYVRRPGATRYAVIALLFATSLFAKPMLVMLPVLLIAVDYWPLDRFQGSLIPTKAALLEKIPLGVISIVCTLLGTTAQASRDMSVKHWPFSALTANALVSYVRYIGKMVWPSGLAMPYPLVPHWPAGIVAGAVLILVGVSVLAAMQLRHRPWLAVGWAWYLIILLPAAGFYGLGDSSMADRYTYFPMIGLLIMSIWSLPQRWVQVPGRWPIATAFSAVTIALVFATRAQSLVWRDNITLFDRAVKTVGPSELACGNLAIALSRSHRCAEAIPHYEQALEFNPRDSRIQGGMAAALDEVGNRSEAVAHYRAAIEMEPDNASFYYNLGTDLVDLNRAGAAVPVLRRAAELDSTSIQPRANLATAMLRSGDFSGAIEQSQKALQSQPGATGIRETLAAALAQSGQLAAAETQYLLAIVNDRNAVNSYNQLGALYLQKQKPAAALFYLKEAVRLDNQSAPAHNNLGVALIATGDPQGATLEFRRAIQLDPSYSEAKRNLELLGPGGQ